MNQHFLPGCSTTLNFVWCHNSTMIFSAMPFNLYAGHRYFGIRRNTTHFRVRSCPTTAVCGQSVSSLTSDNISNVLCCVFCLIFLNGLYNFDFMLYMFSLKVATWPLCFSKIHSVMDYKLQCERNERCCELYRLGLYRTVSSFQNRNWK